MLFWVAAVAAFLLGAIVALPFAIQRARVSFSFSLVWLLVHFAVLGLGRFVLGVPSALLMLFLPLVLSGVLGIRAGRNRGPSPLRHSPFWALAACLPAAVLLNLAGIWVHVDELGTPLGDNGLLFVYVQLAFGLPAQLLLLLVSFAIANSRAKHTAS